MKSGSQDWGALMLMPLVGRKKKDKTGREEIFHIGILSPAFKKRKWKKVSPRPNNNSLTTAYSQ